MEKTNKDGWKLDRSEPGPGLKIFRSRLDYMRNPRNGKTEAMIVLEGADAANIVAVTPDGHIVFVRQYRFGIGADTLELPGGAVDAGEPQADAAMRELAEETGYTAPEWRLLGGIYSNPVFMSSYIFHWLALNAEPTLPQRLDDGEAVEVVLLHEADVWNKLIAGEFQHPHTVNALLRYFADGGRFRADG
ncbi:MAG: NUDIX hydrolase [Saprospiraceae bacterium]|nr:NUDIX hydrolase [Saprospiraceae bacterium]